MPNYTRLYKAKSRPNDSVSGISMLALGFPSSRVSRSKAAGVTFFTPCRLLKMAKIKILARANDVELNDLSNKRMGIFKSIAS